MSAAGWVLEEKVGEAIPGLELPKEACRKKRVQGESGLTPAQQKQDATQN